MFDDGLGAAVGYPGWNNQVAKAFQAYGRGEDIDRNVLNVEDVIFSHRIVFPAAGTTKTFKFFQGSSSDIFTTNWPANNQLPPDNAFWCKGIGFHVELNADIAGDEVAGGEAYDFHATAPTAGDLALAVAGILDAGVVTFKVGNQVRARGPGLSAFPGGCGPFLAAALASNSATTGAYQAMFVNNGVPGQNYRPFDRPQHILPQKDVLIEWNLSATRALAVPIIVRAMMFGNLIYPQNN